MTLFFQMREVRDRLHAAAGRPSWPVDRCDLYLLLGCLMAATARHIGLPAAAEELALAGLTHATVLAHRSLTARLRLDLAIIACSTDMLRDCLAQADTALELAPYGPVRGQLNLIRARVAARLDVGTARHAIAQASQAIDRERAADTVDVVSQIRFSPAAHHAFTGAALLETRGAEQDALTELEWAVKLYRAAAEPGVCDDHDYMTARVDLAVARLRAGDLQAAETTLGPVLALPCPRRISAPKPSPPT